jgi:hypothetical protein
MLKKLYPLDRAVKVFLIRLFFESTEDERKSREQVTPARMGVFIRTDIV